MHQTIPAAVALLLFACNGVSEIDDPVMQSHADDLADQTNSFSTVGADTPESDLQSATAEIGSAMTNMATQHQVLRNGGGGTVPAGGSYRVAQPVVLAGSDDVSWDGERFVGTFGWDFYGFLYLYDVDLTLGSTMDGHLDIVWEYEGLYDYAVRSTYRGVTFDGDGCTNGGVVEVLWDYDYYGLGIWGGAQRDSGRLVITFSDCGETRVEGN